MRAHAHRHAHAHSHFCTTLPHTCTHSYMHLYTHVHTHTCACIRTLSCMHMHTHSYFHLLMHTCTHTDTCTHTRACAHTLTLARILASQRVDWLCAHVPGSGSWGFPQGTSRLLRALGCHGHAGRLRVVGEGSETPTASSCSLGSTWCPPSSSKAAAKVGEMVGAEGSTVWPRLGGPSRGRAPWRLAVVGQERGGCSGSRPVYPGAPDASIKVPQLRPCSQPHWEVGKCQRQKSFNRETSALLTLLQKPARLLFMLL